MAQRRHWPAWAEDEWHDLYNLSLGILAALETCKRFGLRQKRPNLHAVKELLPEIITNAEKIQSISRKVSNTDPAGRPKFCKRMPDWVLCGCEENFDLASLLIQTAELAKEELEAGRQRMMGKYIEDCIPLAVRIKNHIESGPTPCPQELPLVLVTHYITSYRDLNYTHQG